MKLSLSVLTSGKWQGKSIPITRSPFVIGRDPACHLRPGSPLISNRHCAILVRAGKVYLRDFDSTNGTVLDGETVKGEVELHADQQIQVGPITFQLKLTPSVPVDQPTPLPPTKAPTGSAAPSDDDTAAALLLALQDDASPPTEPAKVDAEGIPTGTTVLLPGEAGPPSSGESKPAATGKPAKASGDTSTSAKAILEKYMRRTRG